jgi:O-antigen ligase
VLPSTVWVVVLAAVPVLVTLATARTAAPPLVSICLAVFLASAVSALWATYDRDATRLVFDHPVGWQKLWGLILAVLFFYALVTIPSASGHRWAVGMLTGLGMLVAVSFVATNDWIAQPALWEPITRLGEAIQALLPPLPRGALNPNVAGGVVAPLLPLSLGLAAEGRRVRQATWVAWGLLGALIMALALLLSTSRGAWLGTAGALSLVAVWWLAGKLARAEWRILAFAAVIGLVTVVAGLAWASIAPLRRLVLEAGPIPNRLAIFSQAALLVRDYAFTGSGLGTFPLVHSTYALMIHVPVLSHAHALPLNVALEQGLIGADGLLLAWVLAAGLGLRALARSDGNRPMLAAALVSLAVLVIHSLSDDALYSSRGVLFLWVPVAAVLSAARGEAEHYRSTPVRPGAAEPQAEGRPRDADGELGQPAGAWFRRVGIGVTVLAIVALLMFVWRPVVAAFHANVGAVRQTLVELRAYHSERFGDPTLDEVRRQEDLSAAVRRFERALALDPGQVTARTRLAQIALARRDYDASLGHAQAAWDAGYRDRVTRLVLSDALVAKGRVADAAQIIRGLEQAAMRLDGHAFSRYQRHGDWQRAAYAWRTVLMLDPGNERVRNAAAWAEEKAAQP